MLDFLQGTFDSLFAVGVGVVVGILIDRLGIVDWLKGLIIRK